MKKFRTQNLQSLNGFFNFDVTKKKKRERAVRFVKEAYARIARTFRGFDLNNNSLSKVVDKHDPISAWLLLRNVSQHLLVVFFSLFSLFARTTKRWATRDSYTPKDSSLCRFCALHVQFSSVGVQVQVVPFLVYEKRGKGVYVLLLDFVPSAFVFDCICNIFFNRGTDS